MPALALRATLAGALLLSIGDVVPAQPEPTPAMAEDERLLPYVEPGQLVADLVQDPPRDRANDARLRLRPSRVCFNDPAPRPQILSDVVDDLHAALEAGSILGPYVLGGHSLGGLEARVYAQRWP